MQNVTLIDELLFVDRPVFCCGNGRLSKIGKFAQSTTKNRGVGGAVEEMIKKNKQVFNQNEKMRG